MDSNHNEYDEKSISKAKDTAEEFIKNNYEDVKYIDLETPSTAPMGSLTLDGTVNGKAGFSISLDENLNVSGIAEDEGFPEEKKECRKQFCE